MQDQEQITPARAQLASANGHEAAKPPKTYHVLDYRYESMHPVESLIERTMIKPDELIQILTQSRGVWLNNPDNHWQGRAYILIFSPRDFKFFVAIVACDTQTSTGSIVTVLTQQQYENDRYPIYPHILRRALNIADMSASLVQYYKQMHPEIMSERERKQMAYVERKAQSVQIFVDYRVASGVIDRATFASPPGEFDDDVKNDLTSVVKKDGFWAWLSEQVAQQGINVLDILSLKASRANEGTVSLKVDS